MVSYGWSNLRVKCFKDAVGVGLVVTVDSTKRVGVAALIVLIALLILIAVQRSRDLEAQAPSLGPGNLSATTPPPKESQVEVEPGSEVGCGSHNETELPAETGRGGEPLGKPPPRVTVLNSPGGSSVPPPGVYEVRDGFFSINATSWEYWEFYGWLVNDSLIFSAPALKLRVTGNTTIMPLFVRRTCAVSLYTNVTGIPVSVNGTLVEMPTVLTLPCGQTLCLEPQPSKRYRALNESTCLKVEENLFLSFLFVERKAYAVRYPPRFATAVVREGGLDKYVISVDMWNARYVKGDVEVSYSWSDVVTILCNISKSRTRIYNSMVVGYPEVWIGCKPWGGPCACSYWGLEFPRRDFNLVVETELHLEKTEGTINVALEMWLVTTNDLKVDPTARTSTIELMVWFYYDPPMAKWMIDNMKRQGGLEKYRREVPVIVDGRETNVTFYVFHKRGRWHYVAVFPEDPTVLMGRRIALNISGIIETVKDVHPRLNFEDKWLFGVELGAELAYGPCRFVLTVKHFNVRASSGGRRSSLQKLPLRVEPLASRELKSFSPAIIKRSFSMLLGLGQCVFLGALYPPRNVSKSFLMQSSTLSGSSHLRTVRPGLSLKLRNNFSRPAPPIWKRMFTFVSPLEATKVTLSARCSTSTL